MTPGKERLVGLLDALLAAEKAVLDEVTRIAQEGKDLDPVVLSLYLNGTLSARGLHDFVVGKAPSASGKGD